MRFLYCNHQVHRDFLITLYMVKRAKIIYGLSVFVTDTLSEQFETHNWNGILFIEAQNNSKVAILGSFADIPVVPNATKPIKAYWLRNAPTV
jgi:hypothetical protein